MYQDWLNKSSDAKILGSSFMHPYMTLLYWPPRNSLELKNRNALETSALSQACPDVKPKPPPIVFDPTERMVSFIRGNARLAELRRYILVVVDDHPAPNAYVAHFDQGKWYYIDGKDDVSKKNFELISLFLTMMAVAPATPPLTPTISVGGGG
jgi:hypothetical protein